MRRGLKAKLSLRPPGRLSQVPQKLRFSGIIPAQAGKDCSFTCTGTGGASHVTKLSIYLGAIPVGSGQKAPAVVYEFSTREIPRANGFSVSSGLSTLSCQVNGLTLDYSGPPREGRRTIDNNF